MSRNTAGRESVFARTGAELEQNCAAWPTDYRPGPMSALGRNGRAAPRRKSGFGLSRHFARRRDMSEVGGRPEVSG